MNNNERPNANQVANFPQRAGNNKPGKPKKRMIGVIGGAALAAAVAFGGGAALSQPATSFAQTGTTTPAATPSTGTATPSASTSATSTVTGVKSGRGELGDKGGARGGVSGTISAISGNTLTLTRGSVIVIQATLNSSTVYTKAGQTITLADLKVGQQVSVRTATATDGTISVSAVQIVLSQSNGTVSAVDASSLTLTKSDNSTVKVNLSSSTIYNDLGKTVSLADIKAGAKVEVAGTSNADGSLNGEVVTIEHDKVSGSVTAVSGNSITITVSGKGNRNDSDAATGTTATTATAVTKTITVDGSTVYLEGSQSVALSEVAVGSSISAQGALSSDGNSLTALQVQIQLPHYQGQVASVSGNTIVITARDGSSKTIEVSSATTYLNGQATAALTDIAVGASISVEGKVDAAGKMTASQVQIGKGEGGAGHGRGGR